MVISNLNTQTQQLGKWLKVDLLLGTRVSGLIFNWAHCRKEKCVCQDQCTFCQQNCASDTIEMKIKIIIDQNIIVTFNLSWRSVLFLIPHPPPHWTCWNFDWIEVFILCCHSIRIWIANCCWHVGYVFIMNRNACAFLDGLFKWISCDFNDCVAIERRAKAKEWTKNQ